MRCALAACLALALAGCEKDAAQHILRAKAALYEKRAPEALAEYRRALDALEHDDSPEAQVLRARALRGAADIYYLELRDVRRATEVYRELISLCPEAPETLEARVYLADILKNHFRDHRGAISELTAALARNPPQGAELSYQVAKLYFELGNYQQCELEASSLENKYETSAHVDDALFLRAQALAMMEGRRPEAARAFQQLAERFPDSELQPHALFELGKLRAELGEGEKAIETWVEALRRHPDPKVVQGQIALIRKRLEATTPDAIGEKDKAFDREERVAARERPMARPASSVEAAGGTAEEAAREQNLPPEGAGSPETPLANEPGP
ncbi:MAG: tetratricopeptide repeat protein [Myxococcales bacterium]|nr:tetratricopeptide repeat protein [Myxococcales bacterium]